MSPLELQLPRLSMSIWTLLLILFVTGAARHFRIEEQLQQNGSLSNWIYDGAPGGWTRMFVYPGDIEGTRTEDYNFRTSARTGLGKAWIEAKPGALRDQNSYGALSQRVPAEAFWGQRVRFMGSVAMNGVRGHGFGALFVRVVSGNGMTLAFDNMQGRGIVAWSRSYRWFPVVLDVPGPLEGVCPVEGASDLPAEIHVGFLLCGGGGHMELSAATLEVVGENVPVTGGLPPWEGPGMY